MTDGEIIKALECCMQEDKCKQCPYGMACLDDKYVSIVSKDSLALINRQKAEIERLEEYNQNLQTANTALSNEILEIKSEAIKEFAEKVKQVLELNDLEEYNYVCKLLDVLIKEMEGDNNGC